MIQKFEEWRNEKGRNKHTSIRRSKSRSRRMLTLQICYLLHKHIRRGETLVFLPEIYYNPTQYIYMYVKLNQKENLSPTMPEKFIDCN